MKKMAKETCRVYLAKKMLLRDSMAKQLSLECPQRALLKPNRITKDRVVKCLFVYENNFKGARV